MRHILFVSLVTTFMATGAQAAPRSPLHPIDSAKLPAACQPLAVEPASAQIDGPDFAAHISVANCLAETAMAGLTLRADASSIDALDAAAAPSVAIFADVIEHGDASWKKLAESAKADLFLGMVVRMRSVANDPTDHLGLESKMRGWLDQGNRAAKESTSTAVR